MQDTDSLQAKLLFTVACASLFLPCLVGCREEATPGAGEAATPTAQAALDEAKEPGTQDPAAPSVVFAEGSALISGESIVQDSDGTIHWEVPGEAKFQVSLPYRGDPPESLIMQLVWMSAQGETQIGSISTKPQVDGQMLKYETALPVLAPLEGRQKCKIRTVNPTVGPKPVTIHEGDLEIEFEKNARGS
jgi:hypothetical protein